MIFYLVGGGGRGFCLALKRINRQATSKARTSGEIDGAFHNIAYNENAKQGELNYTQGFVWYEPE